MVKLKIMISVVKKFFNHLINRLEHTSKIIIQTETQRKNIGRKSKKSMGQY